MKKLSVIVPCFNESKTIIKIIEKILDFKNQPLELIVIDDFSTDGTREILRNELKNKIDHIIFNEKNYGKGYSIRQGIKKITGDIVIIQDADLEYNPNDYDKIIKPFLFNNADVVYGSRFTSPDEKRILYFWHTVGNYFLTLFSNIMTNLNLTDMECCYKAFKSSVLKKIELNENRFGFEPEITAKISKMDLIIYEVGVKYYGRKYKDGKKITWKDGISAIRCILKYNLQNSNKL
jgi:glycosyltransferase involved in cell wall biosynthesis